MPMNVLVYDGPGLSEFSLAHTLYSLRDLLGSSYAVEKVSPSQLASQPWAPTCALLVLPGGRDLLYLSALAAANGSIRSYVEQGGSFLGFCAGAYYASRRVEWEDGTEMQVVGDRPLGFYPGVSEGCVYKGFQYRSEAGARAVAAKTTEALNGTPSLLRGLYYNGGGHFVGADKLREQGVVPLLRYTEDDGANKVAALWSSVGKGIAVLSHIHLEYPLSFEPATSALTRAYPTLSDADKAFMDTARKEALRSVLRLLGLRLPDITSLPQNTLVPLPQILVASPSTPYIGKAFLDRLEPAISKTSYPAVYKSLQDQNDVFHIYESPQHIGHLISEARRQRFEGAEPPQSFPKSILICAEGQLPSPNDTPLFNVPQYFQALASRQRPGSGSTGSSSFLRQIGDILLYGELVTSTQTLLDKNPVMLRALPVPLLSLATNQLKGRGRGSNAWVTPRGSLPFSLVLRPPRNTLPNSSLVFVQYLASLVITETCRELMGPEDGGKIRIKWPNDIYARVDDPAKKEPNWIKVGGILVNTSFSGGDVDIIVGVGLNVLNERPTISLSKLISPLSHVSLHLEVTAAALMVKFDVMWNKFINAQGSFEPFLDLYLERWLHSDQLVTLTTTVPPTSVRVVGITRDRGLLRTIPADAHTRRWDERTDGYIDLQPDGNSFDMMAGLIRMKT